VALGACKGYPSLTFLYDASHRFKWAASIDKLPVIIYFGDYDPSGEDIPRSIAYNLQKFGINVEVKRIALNEDQVRKWDLPPAPAKLTDTRTSKWNGIGQVELDAVKPETLEKLTNDALRELFDYTVYNNLMAQESIDKVNYRDALRDYVKSL
jgi:hypothetical protein